jgi:hypothetical protein
MEIFMRQHFSIENKIFESYIFEHKKPVNALVQVATKKQPNSLSKDKDQSIIVFDLSPKSSCTPPPENDFLRWVSPSVPYATANSRLPGAFIAGTDNVLI